MEIDETKLTDYTYDGINSTIQSYDIEFEHKYLNIKLIILWISSIIILVGIIANLISLIVFIKPNTVTSTNIYLASLCACNCIALVGLLINSVLYNKFSLYEYFLGVKAIMSFYPYVYPLITTSQIASIYLTTSVSLNQFITIAFSKLNSTHQKSVNKSMKQKDNQRAFKIVSLIILMSIIFCLPYWFTFQYSEENGLQSTELSKQAYFKRIVHFYMYLPFACVIPVLVLIVTNTYLISTLEVTIRRKRRLRQTTTSRSERASTSLSLLNSTSRSTLKTIRSKLSITKRIKTKFENRSTTLMLISFVFFFLICQFPTLLLNLIESLDQSYKAKWYYLHLVEFSKLLLIINLSFNFAIFFLFSKRFRQTLKNMLCTTQINSSKTNHVII